MSAEPPLPLRFHTPEEKEARSMAQIAGLPSSRAPCELVRGVDIVLQRNARQLAHRDVPGYEYGSYTTLTRNLISFGALTNPCPHHALSPVIGWFTRDKERRLREVIPQRSVHEVHRSRDGWLPIFTAASIVC